MYLKTSLLYLEFCVFYQSTWVTPTHWQKPQQWWKISLTQSDSLAAQYWKHRHRFGFFYAIITHTPALDINQKFFHTKFQTCDKKKKFVLFKFAKICRESGKKKENKFENNFLLTLSVITIIFKECSEKKLITRSLKESFEVKQFCMI